MRLYEDAWRRDDLPRGGVVTIGNFDGLHRGQQALLGAIRERAEALGAPALALTFEPHPMRVLSPERAPRRLTTRGQKHDLIGATGVDGLVEIDFSEEVATTSARDFVRDFLVARLALAEIHVGSNFTFGRQRDGDLGLLTELSAEGGFSAHGVDEVLHEGEPISSTRIRAAVGAGRVEEACVMLGRPFALIGAVTPGDGRGRQLGWPTANLAIENETTPGDGVYASEVLLNGEETIRPSVTNVGSRPTFAGEGRHVETHLLDYSGDLYGRKLELRFHKRLRGERRFSSPEELVEQIEADAEEAREYLASSVC